MRIGAVADPGERPADSTVTATRMGSVYEVNNADVTCGNLRTANATVYIINTVLMPPR